MRFGVTVAGDCNGNTSILDAPGDVALDLNNTLYVANTNNRLLIFPLNNLTGQTLQTFSSRPCYIYFDQRTLNFYISFINQGRVYIRPANKTIPPNGINYNNCSLNGIWTPTIMVVDSNGTVYISSYNCNFVTKWLPDATTGILVAGSPTGSYGSTSTTLYIPYGLALDEINGYLYVADRYNSRIQRFNLNGSNIGTTILGSAGVGTNANQLNLPTDIYLSKIDGSHCIFVIIITIAFKNY